MNKVLLSILAFTNLLFAQSLANMSNLANQELEKIKNDLKNSSLEIKEENEIKDINQVSDKKTLNVEDKDLASSKYFGLDYFNKQITFFDNLPTPVGYVLGPGDEIIISMWGETNSRDQFIINKEGLIFYPDVGFINLSNKTLKQAELFLIEKLSDIYSTLSNKDNPTTLMLELGSLKSINVYFSGQIKSPGVNLIHPFSDIFSAIIQAGGITENGSLRNIELIRNGEIIKQVDFYSFFIDGRNNFSNIKILDGDIIHVPVYLNRIKITGEVNQPYIYELLPGESLHHLIDYASGLTSNASSFLILNQIIPIEKRDVNDNAKKSMTLNLKNKDSIVLNNGDDVEILSIPSVDSHAEVYGRVKFPGKYPATNNTLKDILDIAGGFNDPSYRKTINLDEIVIMRADEKNYYSIEIKTTYSNANEIKLLPYDKIFIYEDKNFLNSFTYTITGEVNKPGTYPMRKGLTISDAIKIAGGVTEFGNPKNIILEQKFTELKQGTAETSTNSVNVLNATLDYQLGTNSIIKVLPFENTVKVNGNVYNPGLVAYNENLSLSRAISLAGGYKSNSLKRKVYIKRGNGRIEKSKIFKSNKIYPGDTIFVPENMNPKDFDVSIFLADLSSTLANIAAILILIDNQQN